MAFFFKKFNEIEYRFLNTQDSKKVTNILTAFFLRKVASYTSLIFQRYTIRDDDSVESLSEKLYGSPSYYWTLLVVNDIIDPYTEWAMESSVLEKFVAKKYKNGKQVKLKDGSIYTVPVSSGTGGIHHFFNIETDRICDDVEDEYYRTMYISNPLSIGNNIVPVSNLEYEKDIGISRRSIQVVSKPHIISFEENFGKMLTSGRTR